MLIHRPLLTAACFVTAVVVSACAGDPRNGASLTAPTAQNATAPLVVQVDNICAGQESNVRVFVDFVQMGVTNPGDPGVSRMVTIGEHQLSAVSARGTQWGPFPTTVVPGGRIERLGCMPAEAL
jgi:hypothetical protein